MYKLLSLTCVGLLATGCGTSQTGSLCDGFSADGQAAVEVLPADEVVWGALNPARGDKSPRAADLWGDRTADGATGFLVKFVDGFESPPHIHNVTYRGVVISGDIHNDRPEADYLWMGPGSFWVQPAGGDHITAARGTHNLAYIEIGSGPYLVQPSDEAFGSADQPLNLPAADLAWEAQDGGVQRVDLWGDADDANPAGAMVKLPAGFRGVLRGCGASLRAVVIDGGLGLHTTGRAAVLGPGSYFGAPGAAEYPVVVDASGPATVYVRSAGAFDVLAE